jgi:salicylate hydroxylase
MPADLIELGRALLAPHVIAPDSISIMTARTAKEIGRVPSASRRAALWRALLIVRRADLQSALLARAASHLDIDRGSVRSSRMAVYPKGVTVVQRRVSERQQEPALALIGADGVWSSVRHQIFPEAQPQFTGSIAWRGTVDASQLPRGFMTQRVQLWMGTNAHLVAYPMSGGKRINMVAIVSGNGTGRAGVSPATWSKLPIILPTRTGRLPRMMIGAVDAGANGRCSRCVTAVSGTRDRLPCSVTSRAMLPFAAQGAAWRSRTQR